MGQHLVFYDGNCGLCDHVVQAILRYDKKQIFDFAPLQGSTAKKLLQDLPAEITSADSLILIENYKDASRKCYILGKGALKIAWALGGMWSIPGLISWAPPFFYDWAYRLIAKNRHRIFSNDTCVIPQLQSRGRFLP